ncbi:hypothetical protein BG846_01914 [Streptomyces fradiae ATCC 10745 = DSM 40063]|uniref:Uncharacterized protein n=1 Tax=Streptomyces fradiae ATCC 10745 = DSM 40063 TaxID=1319510 RepID=A0A1Y2NZS4_STRFR|nr:hypothetical protein BG846_01914 [Streptomyces fradiae ATCC 10745 = DSM 40063]
MPARALGQRQMDGDAVHVGGDGAEVHGEPVLGRRPAGHLDTGQGRGAGMGDAVGRGDGPGGVAERGPRRHRHPGRHPDLQSGAGQRVVLPPDQLGGHRLSPPRVVAPVADPVSARRWRCVAARAGRAGRLVALCVLPRGSPTRQLPAAGRRELRCVRARTRRTRRTAAGTGGPPPPADAQAALTAAAGRGRRSRPAAVRTAAAPGRRGVRPRARGVRPCRYRWGRIAGIRSWNVRPFDGAPMAVMVQPPPVRCTFAMICAVYCPPPARV